MSDPTNRADKDADTVPIDPDVTDDTTTTGSTSHTEHKEEGTNRVVNDTEEGTYTDIDLPDDETGSGVGSA